MDIAPGALDRVVEKDAPPAARLEQAVDPPDAPLDRLAGIPTIARALLQRDLQTGAGEAHHLGENAEHPLAGPVNLGSRLGEAELDERILGGTRLGGEAYPAARLLAKGIEGTERNADRRRRDAVAKNEANGRR